MIRACILGGDSFAAGELIRLLINHPDVELSRVQSRIHNGELITEVHQGMEGETYLRFTPEVNLEDLDVVFCCYPHATRRGCLPTAPFRKDSKSLISAATSASKAKSMNSSTACRK